MKHCLFCVLAFVAAGCAFADDVVYVPNQTSASGAINSGLKVGSTFTFEAWVLPDDVSDENKVVGVYNAGGNDIALAVMSGKGRMFFRNFASENILFSQQRVVSRQWVHLAAACDGEVLSLYVNGVLGGTLVRTATSPLLPSQVNMYFGGLKSDDKFRGRVSDVRYWTTCRTAAEIAANMGRRLAGTEAGLAGYWPLTDGEGTTVANLVPGTSAGTHASGTGGWVTMANSPFTPANHDFGVNDDFALAVNSSNSVVDTRLTPAASTNFTFEAWVKPTDVSGENIILACYAGSGTQGDFSLRLNGNIPQLWLRGTNADENHAVKGSRGVGVGQWYHLAGVYDGTTMKIYNNGALDGTMVVSNATTVVQGVNLIVGGLTVGQTPFRGSVREVRYWNVVRTAEEIAANWSRQLVGNEEGLLGYWPLNEKTGDYARNLATAFGVNGYAVAANRAEDLQNPFHSYVLKDKVYQSKAMNGLDSKLKIKTVAFTLEGWVRPTDWSGENVIMAQYAGDANKNDMVFKIENGGNPQIFLRKASGSSNSLKSANKAPTNQWTHLCAVVDEHGFQLYVNGELDCERRSEDSVVVTMPPSDVALYIAGLRANTGFRGCLGELRCWNVARTAAEIKAAYCERLTGAEAGLLGYWPLDGGGDPSVVESVAFPRIYRISCPGDWVDATYGYPFFRLKATQIFFR